MCCGLTLSRNCKPLPFLGPKWSTRVSTSPTSLCAYTHPLQPPRALPRLFRARHMRACPASRMAYAPRAHPVHDVRKYAPPKHPAGVQLAHAPLHTACPRPACPTCAERVAQPRALSTPYAKAQLRKTPMQTTKDFIQMHQLEERVRCAGGKRLEGNDPNTEHINRPQFRSQGPCSDLLTASWFSEGGRKIINT